MSGIVRLRPATLTDVPLLAQWDAQPHVRAATGRQDDDDLLDWAEELAVLRPPHGLLVAELDDRPIGMIAYTDPATEPTHYWGDCEPNLRAMDIWIGEPDCLGRGFGTQMMRQALDLLFAVPAVTAVLLDPRADNVRAQRFYERLGFVAVERRVFPGGDACVVYRFERAAWNAGSGQWKN